MRIFAFEEIIGRIDTERGGYFSGIDVHPRIAKGNRIPVLCFGYKPVISSFLWELQNE